MSSKLKSRKFWITFAVSVVLLFAQQLGLDVDGETVWGIVAMITGYNAGQGYVDGQKEKAAGNAALSASVEDRLAALEAQEDAEPEPDDEG